MTTPARARFNDAYQSGTPPWVIGEPQPAIVELEQTGMIGGPVLGVDFAPNAVDEARENAAAQGVDARFEVADAMDLGVERARYVASLHRAIRPGGVLHLLALSDAGRGFGPSVSERVIREAFSDGWQLEALDTATYRGIVGQAHAESLGLAVGTVVDEPAWLARVRRS